jgi:hypothetical protein
VTTGSQQQPAVPQQPAGNPLTACLIALAGTPDDASWIDCQLLTTAQSSADLIAPVAYASITGYRDDAVTTVAASSDIARAVDRAQYDARSGPCLDALDTAAPIAVPDVAATMRWPGFRECARGFGIGASLSVPLFAGQGVPVAALNLHSHDAQGLGPLSAAVRVTYDPEAGPGPVAAEAPLDRGGEAFIAGLAGAFAVRARIQQAIGVIMATTHRTPDAAYLVLRMRAAETGTALTDAATAVITDQQI